MKGPGQFLRKKDGASAGELTLAPALSVKKAVNRGSALAQPAIPGASASGTGGLQGKSDSGEGRSRVPVRPSSAQKGARTGRWASGSGTGPAPAPRGGPWGWSAGRPHHLLLRVRRVGLTEAGTQLATRVWRRRRRGGKPARWARGRRGRGQAPLRPRMHRAPRRRAPTPAGGRRVPSAASLWWQVTFLDSLMQRRLIGRVPRIY